MHMNNLLNLRSVFPYTYNTKCSIIREFHDCITRHRSSHKFTCTVKNNWYLQHKLVAETKNLTVTILLVEKYNSINSLVRSLSLSSIYLKQFLLICGLQAQITNYATVIIRHSLSVIDNVKKVLCKSISNVNYHCWTVTVAFRFAERYFYATEPRFEYLYFIAEFVLAVLFSLSCNAS